MSQRRVVDDVVEQHPQVGVDLVAAAHLLVEIPGEHLDVARLVDDLGEAYNLASYHGTVSVILAVHSSAPCSPWRNCDSVHLRFWMPNASHSFSPQ